MKDGMHKMPGGGMMKDSEMKVMMKREKMPMKAKPMMKDEYETPGWAKKSDKMGKPAKKKMKKGSAKY